VHTGEVELAEKDVRGIAVHIASRVAHVGRADDVLVSRTVKDLVAGSGIKFEDFGPRVDGSQGHCGVGAGLCGAAGEVCGEPLRGAARRPRRWHDQPSPAFPANPGLDLGRLDQVRCGHSSACAIHKCELAHMLLDGFVVRADE
jgi:hypothetical protein